MSKSLERRIARLENQPPSAADVRTGLRLYHETGKLPNSPRTRDVVLQIVQFLDAADATIPDAPTKDDS